MTEQTSVISREAKLVLFVVMIGTFLSVLDSVILNIALPYIMATFSADVQTAKWVMAGFMIAATISMPLTGWLGDRFSYGVLYTVSLVIFTGGALLGFFAWSLDALIVARIIQGLGAGVVQPASIAILTASFPPHVRGRVFGVWVIGWMTAPMLGPVTGGLIIEYFSWRTIFTMSTVLGLIATLLAATVLSRQRKENPPPFDWPGYLALTTFLVTAFLVITYGEEEGWGSEIIVFGMFTSLTAFAILLVVEWGKPDAIVPLRLFRIPDFSLAAFITIYRALGLFGPYFLLPLFLFQVQDRESISIGLMLMPGAVAMSVFSPIAGAFTDRFGGRGPAIVGILALAFSLFLYTDIDLLSPVWKLIYPQIIQGTAIALVMTPLVTMGMNAVQHADTGHASWILNLCQRGGGAFAITILGTLLHRQTIIQRDYLGSTALLNEPPPAAMTDLSTLFGFAAVDQQSAMTAASLQQIGQAASSLAFNNLFFMIAALTVTAVIPAYMLSKKQPPVIP